MGKYWIQSHVLLSLLLLYFFFFTSCCSALSQNDDVGGRSGKMVNSSVSMALSDYKTRISLSFRDSHGEPLLALPAGMMGEGFSWIFTAKSINNLHEDFTNEAMEGVVGFKSYIPMSKKLHNFTLRWRKSLTQLSISGLWAHDIIVVARAVEVARMPNVSLTLLEVIIESKFKGLSGNFQLDDKKLLPNMTRLGETRVGFWYPNGSFSSRRKLCSTHNNLETIIWRCGYAQSPKGFCVEVFKASIRPFNYEVEFIPWRNESNYDHLAYALSRKKDKYDVAVGDITITSNRSMYVDFTMPFIKVGFGFVVQKERSGSMWMFLQPLTLDLWKTTVAFFVLAGIIVWLIERSENTKFQGSWSQHIGVVIWFGFSTLAHAHRERLKHNLSRFVVIVWVFVVLLFSQLYRYFPSSYQIASYSPIQPDQVFINYRGEQLGYSFVSHLVDAFERHQINFFQDKYELRGKDLKNIFVKIEESKIALAIFSTRYTESRWCMDELVKMKKLVDKRKLQVIPIFYKVKPGDVRKQTGKFGDNFWKLARVSSGDQIKNWKEALECISNKMGLSLKDKYSEADFVKEVVMEVKRVIAGIRVEKGE